MVTFLITSVLLLGIFAIAVYFWQRTTNTAQPTESLLPLSPRSLFDDPPEAPAILTAGNSEEALLMNRAQEGDKTVLFEIQATNNLEFYNAALNTLVSKNTSPAELLALISFVTRNELLVNENLAAAFIDVWEQSPDRSSTAKMLHIAALSDSAEVFRRAVELALSYWRSGHIPGLSGIELQALLTGEFWVLSSRARNSGGGFLLKRTLATARRELETNNTNHPTSTASS